MVFQKKGLFVTGFFYYQHCFIYIEKKGDKIMKIIKANERNIYIEADSPIILNSYLEVEDVGLGNIIVEVIDVENFRNANGEYVYSANCKPLRELGMAINPRSKIFETSGHIAKKYLLPSNTNSLLSLGVIKSTELLQKDLGSEMQNMCQLFEDGKVIPQNGVPFLLDVSKFREYPHVGFIGGSGSGKTYAMRVYCEELMEKKFPGILLDPHNEMDFSIKSPHFNRSYEGRYEIFQIGKNIGINFSELATMQLLELVEFMGELSSPMRVALEQIHSKGDSVTYLLQKIESLQFAFANEDKPAREQQTLPPDVAKLYNSLKNKIAGSSTLQALSWRMEGLVKQKIFSHDINALEKSLKTRKLCVIRGSKRELNMIASFVVRKMYQKRRDYVEYGAEKTPPFFVITDEAHIFAPKDSETPTTKLFVELAQEARKYGVFLAFATQRPTLLHPTIMAQLNTKFIFRTVIASDIRVVKTETNLTMEEGERLPSLNSGNAFVSSPTCKKSSIRFRVSNTLSPNSQDPFDELEDFDDASPLEGYVLDYLPIRDIKMPEVLRVINSKYNSNYTIEELVKVLELMTQQGLVHIKKTPMGKEYQ